MCLENSKIITDYKESPKYPEYDITFSKLLCCGQVRVWAME
jgi:hypothetical protein